MEPEQVFELIAELWSSIALRPSILARIEQWVTSFHFYFSRRPALVEQVCAFVESNVPEMGPQYLAPLRRMVEVMSSISHRHSTCFVPTLKILAAESVLRESEPIHEISVELPAQVADLLRLCEQMGPLHARESESTSLLKGVSETSVVKMPAPWPAEDVATEITAHMWALFRSIESYELIPGPLQRPWAGPHPEYTAPNLHSLIKSFNHLSAWPQAYILLGNDWPVAYGPDLTDIAQLWAHAEDKTPQGRVNRLCWILDIAWQLRMAGNLNGAVSLSLALASSAVQRLHSAWTLVDSVRRERWESLVALIDPHRNHEALRTATYHQSPPILPYIGLIVGTITSICDQNPVTLGGDAAISPTSLINFRRARWIASLVRHMQAFQCVPFPLSRTVQGREWTQTMQAGGAAGVIGLADGLRPAPNMHVLHSLSLLAEPR